ncbi:hypothetical protein [Burkholderia reimsis]|uniref:hypothetical protein n=1 Tax=Burkholderia reimsis TaxID=2234132 RepID=UPI001058E2FC|nr:hypothetical protein [Burkholderia reimsis]
MVASTGGRARERLIVFVAISRDFHRASTQFPHHAFVMSGVRNARLTARRAAVPNLTTRKSGSGHNDSGTGRHCACPRRRTGSTDGLRRRIAAPVNSRGMPHAAFFMPK